MLQNPPLVAHSSWDGELIVATRKKIEEGIAGHHHAVIELKIRLNTLILIARLPSEILSEIFQHYVNAILSVDSSSSHRLSYEYCLSLNHFKISHVCHRWREVALNSPRLWSHIDAGLPNITREFLARSKAAPLTVKFRHSRVSSDSLLQVIEAFPRIQELNLYLYPPQYAQLASIFPKEANRLQRVTLTNPSTASGFPTLFDKCALPSLQDLLIDGYLVLLPNPIFVSTLTRLVVRIPQWPESNVPIDKVFDVLQDLQDLQHLELSQLGSLVIKPNDQVPHARRQVTLPKLASLYLTHEVSVCAYTLRQLVIPSSATVELHLTRETGGVDMTPLIPVAFDKLSGNSVLGPRLPVLSAGLWQTCKETTWLCCWRDGCFDNIPYIPDKADFVVSFKGQSCPIETFLKHFGSMVPVEEIVSFCMQGDGRNTGPVGWSDVLEKMPNIEALHAIDLDVDELMEILSPPKSDGDKAGADADFLLRKLTRLKISDVKFPYEDDGEYFSSLLDILRSRQEACGRLKILELANCSNFSQNDFVDFVSVVKGVKWDGMEMTEADKVYPTYEDDDDDDDEDEDEDDEDDIGYPFRHRGSIYRRIW